MEIFMELNKLSPMRVMLKNVLTTIDGPLPCRVSEEDMVQTTRNFRGYLPQGLDPSGVRRTFNQKRVAEKMVEFLQRFDEKEIDGKPDRSPPIGIPSKKARGRFCGFIVHTVLHSVDMKHIGMVLMIFGKSSNPVWGKKFFFVQKVP
jgi:hypothetical protein